VLAKLVVLTVFLAMAGFLAALYYTGQSPQELIKTIRAEISKRGSSTPQPGPAAGQQRSLTYHYHLEVQGLAPLDYTVRVTKLQSSSGKQCFTYHIQSVNTGKPGDVRDFMYGFMGYKHEGETICTTLDPQRFEAKYYFTSPSVTGTADITYGANNELQGKATVEKGVLTHMTLSGKLGGERQASLEITLAR
jgi:hypothetical protein